jgi:biopolymer transport protein ExbD
LLVRREQFRATLHSLLDQSFEPIVIVECADQVSHGTFVQIVDDAKSCGAAQIAVVGR